MRTAREFLWLVVLLTATTAFAQPYEPIQGPDPRGLWITNADGGNQHKLALLDYECSSPSWSPDGKQIVLETRSPGLTRIEGLVTIVDADGKRPRTIGRGSLPSWSPDGKQ